MDVLGGYRLRLYSDDVSRKFKIGDMVFVWLKSNRSTGLATVLQTPNSLPCDSPFAGRYLVQYDIDHALTAHVRPERLYPVYTEQKLVVVCYHTECYRRLARSQVTSSDQVLEIGCSYGMCTNILAEHAGHVIGLDNSEDVVAEARRRYPHLQFEVADVLDQPAAVLDLVKNSSSSIDNSSSNNIRDRSSSQRNSSLPCVSTAGDPQCPLAAGQTAAAAPEGVGHHTSSKETAAGGTAAVPANGDTDNWQEHDSSSDAAAGHADGSSCSSKTPGSSTNAVHSNYNIVFVDIGGNRQLDALLRLIPWVLKHLQPGLLVVKSEELAAAASKQLHVQEQQEECAQHRQQEPQHDCVTQQQHRYQQQISSCNCNCNEVCCSSTSPKYPTYGDIQQPSSWWKQLELQTGLNMIQHVGVAEPWFINARSQGFVKNPLRYPQRFTQGGVRICRPHNYDRCFKIDTCDFDHVHCHHCGVAGHRAVDCPVA